MPTDIAGRTAQGRPAPVQVDDNGIVAVKGQGEYVVRTPPRPVPGIAPSVAYAAEDALGTKFTIPVPPKGIILSALLIDTDDNTDEIDFLLFDRDFTGGTDNSAFTLAAGDHEALIGVFAIDTFKAVNGDQIGVANNIGLAYSAPEGVLNIQAVTQGTQNFGSGTGVSLILSILAD